MPPPAPESHRQSPLHLIAVATAVAGMVASRSVIGKVALAAAAGAAAYRWANKRQGHRSTSNFGGGNIPPVALSGLPVTAQLVTRLKRVAKEDLGPDPQPETEESHESAAHLSLTHPAEATYWESPFPPAPESTPALRQQPVEKQLCEELTASFEDASGAGLDDGADPFDDAPVDSHSATGEIAATFEDELMPVFDGNPVLQSAPPPPSDVIMDLPTQESLPTIEPTVILDTPIQAIFDQPLWVLSMEPMPPIIEAQTADINASLFESGAFSREGQMLVNPPEMQPKSEAEPVTEAPILSRAHMEELLSALSRKIPTLTQEPREFLPSPPLTSQMESTPNLVPPLAEVPVSVAALFAKLASQPPPEATEEPPVPVTTPASGPLRRTRRPMITVPSASNPLRKNWLTWWK